MHVSIDSDGFVRHMATTQDQPGTLAIAPLPVQPDILQQPRMRPLARRRAWQFEIVGYCALPVTFA